MDLFSQPVTRVKGIGPKKEKLLAKMDIHSLWDALHLYPRDYEIWPKVAHIDSILENEAISLAGYFVGLPKLIRRSGRFSILKWTIEDETGTATCLWFNQPYKGSQYKAGIKYCIRGKAIRTFGEIQIQNPLIEEYDSKLHERDRINPIYPLISGLRQKDLQNITGFIIENMGDNTEDSLPLELREELKLMDIYSALKKIHFPLSMAEVKGARRRLIFDEFFHMQMALFALRQEQKDGKKGLLFKWERKDVDEFINGLPFSLTQPQERVFKEIGKDLLRDIPMNRLLYGDVGSGKTIIAALALYITFLSGYQGVLMVPTEILARQHYESLKSLFAGRKIEIAILISGLPPQDKKKVKEDLSNNKIDIIVGTHALLQEDVTFNNLGLVITDEQHRFGVRQRAAVSRKGEKTPNILVMSATPIPRTLAHIFYGDLDISIIDSMPPGRKPIKTYHVLPSMRSRIYAFIRKQVKMGYQGYMVCPLVEKSDEMDLKSATEIFDLLRKGELKDLNLGLIHGRMKPQEKEEAMNAFVGGDIDLLISTTVIEVGINVPKANFMVVENAERFGLSSLHQLRGRIGRGNSQGYCILISEAKGEDTKARMDILVKSNNGFEISQKDLELRGPGQFFGTRQHGLPEFNLADPSRDLDILKDAQFAAEKIMKFSNQNFKKDLLKKSYGKFRQNLEKPLEMN